MYKLKITKGSNITWDIATSAEIEKSREVTMEKIQAMIFIQHSSRRYDRMQRELENNMSKGRDEYLTMVKSAYNLILECYPELS